MTLETTKLINKGDLSMIAQNLKSAPSLKWGLAALAIALGTMAAPSLKAIAQEPSEQPVSAKSRLVAAPAFGLSALAAYPNPCRIGTNVRYRLNTAASSVNVTIYDGQGQVVRHLPGGTAVGLNEVTWALDDDGGAPLASGVYLARVIVRNSDAKVVEQTKIAVMR